MKYNCQDGLCSVSFPSYFGRTTPVDVKHTTFSSWAALAIVFVASGSLAVLLEPVLTTGMTSLFTTTLPKVAGIQVAGLQIQKTQRFIEPLSRPERSSEVNAHLAPSNPAPGSAPERKFLLGAIFGLATALAFRFGQKKSAGNYAALGASAAATLEPPAVKQEMEVNNKGIVTAEEGTDLPFTMTELRDAIPKECFEKNLGWSLFYFARDWAIVAMMYYFQPTFFGLGILGKVVWWNIVGFYGWCLFVVGHDCGHGSFSNYGWLNQLLGHVCHAPLCVPFNAWRISHRHHHQFHNDVDRDHSWRPSIAQKVDQLPDALKWVRFSPLILLAYPYYLLSTSQENGFSGCHFWPWNPLFKKEERLGVGLSALAVVGWLGVLAAATAKLGFWTMFQGYWIPYMIFVTWLDLVTLMQHTDKNALFFRGETWNYLRGAMSTIDRTYRHLIDPFNLGYGRLIDHLHHNISDGHVVHHIFFTQIPHYRLIAATNAIKPILGKHYRFDDTHILKAFWTTMQDCWFVDDVQEGVVTYKGKEEFKAWKAQQAVQGLA